MPGAFWLCFLWAWELTVPDAQLEPHYRCTEKPLSILPHHTTHGEEEKRKHSFFNPFSKPAAARQEKAKIALEAHTNMGSSDHRYFEENKLCWKSGQLRHWCKHMDSICMWALELHGYKFWQFTEPGCSMKWVPNCAQIQMVGSPLCLADDFPSPVLPTGL